MYYFLRQDLFDGHDVIEIDGHTDETGSRDWLSGAAFADPLPPQTLLLDPAYGRRFPELFDTTVPVMSSRLLEVLEECGVANLDRYPVVLRNKVTGEETSGYSAVNVIGIVDAADLDRSEYRPRFGKPKFTGKITIDAARTEGANCFRLLYGPGLIVVSESVAQKVRAANLFGVLMQNTQNYQGT